jgi:hypothetical membrane protein
MTTTKGSSGRPVGATPWTMASISTSCVKLMTISTTTWSGPTVRETIVIAVSCVHMPMKCSA